MIALYESVEHLDRRAVGTFGMSEELLMEHAALAMKRVITERFETANVLIVAGSGNNGADGLALARLLLTAGGFEVSVFMPLGVASELAARQLERIRALGVRETEAIEPCDILVDALFGSGFNRKLDDWGVKLISQMDMCDAFKIACDVPSGVSKDGNYDTCARMDITVTMGAPKLALFNDRIKDKAGDIVVADLGLPREAYMGESDAFLLEPQDWMLPVRENQDSHKGSYGHLATVMGEKPGAAVLCALAALRFGAGLSTVIAREHHLNVPFDLMQSRRPQAGTTAVALGMGLGEAFIDDELLEMIDDLPVALDADALARPMVLKLLQKKHPLVLTPHPKEFAGLLKLCDLGSHTVEEVQENRLELARKFSEAFPEAVLLLKGANVIIAHQNRRYLNPHGSPVLAKGGSGDVLTGLIGSLLAQGYGPLEAAVTASLAHTEAAARYEGADFSMLPTDLIAALSGLGLPAEALHPA